MKVTTTAEILADLEHARPHAETLCGVDGTLAGHTVWGEEPAQGVSAAEMD